MSKGTILYIGGFELPDKNAAAQRVVSNAKVLRDLGYDVIFVGLSPELQDNKKIESTKSIFENFIFYNYKYPNSVLEWIKYLSNINHIKRFIDSSTVAIIAYNYPGLALLKLIKYLKNKNVKIIADCTEWYQPSGNFIYVVLKKLDSYLRMQVAHKKVDALIAISNYLEKYYKQFNVKVVNVPPLVDLEMNKWEDLKNNSNGLPIKLIYCGSPGTGKDKLDFLINVINSLIEKHEIDVEFIIVGLTANEYNKKYNESYNLNRRIIFKGRLPHIEALKFIAIADFQIFLRDNNLINNAGFPTKLVESISCGTPVITNQSSNISDFLVNGKNGYLLKEEEIEDYSTQLLEIFKNERNISCMNKYCYQSRLFHYKNYKNEFIKIFEK